MSSLATPHVHEWASRDGTDWDGYEVCRTCHTVRPVVSPTTPQPPEVSE